MTQKAHPIVASEASRSFLPRAAPEGEVLARTNLAFRSGMSRAQDFWAAAEAGVPVGVVATELRTGQVLLAIPKILRKGGHVFIDSGAFAEIRTATKPDFNRVLSVYESIVDCESPEVLRRLYVVAPDKVGDQLESLARLESYSPRVRALIDSGCQVIVPLQRGSIPVAEMLKLSAEILGTKDFVVGVPSNKEALSVGDCSTLRHARFHILGRVQMDKDQDERLKALIAANPGARISADANWLRSRLGLVTGLSNSEKERRMKEQVSSIQSFSSSRSVAISAAIKADPAWGREFTARISETI